MNKHLKSLTCLVTVAAFNGLIGIAAVSAGATSPGAAGSSVGTGVNTSGATGITGTVNGNRNPNRRNPDVQQPEASEPSSGGATDSLQQQRQQSGEQMIQERKGQSGDTR